MARIIFGNFSLFYSETFHYFTRKLFTILLGNFSPFHSETFHYFTRKLFTILMAIIYFLTLSHIDNGVNQAELAV